MADQGKERLHVAMGQLTLNAEELFLGSESLAGEGEPERFHKMRRPMGQVGQGPFPDLFPLPVGFPQQNVRLGIAIGDGLDMDIYQYMQLNQYTQGLSRYLHVYIFDPIFAVTRS